MSRRVGRYVVERELGSGGTATVYLARQLDLDRLVALKQLGAVRSDPAFVRRFLRESRLAASLAHPNIVTVHDYFEQGGTPYIAMEYVAGGSLRPHIGRLSLAQIGGVLAGVLAGLAHAERRGIVHRDLKPENLLVTDDGQVKITDFGIAKAISSAQTASGLTAAGTTLGTPNYMAPEQAMGQAVGPWSDLYAVGIVAYEMLVGRVPFRDTEQPMAVLMRQVHERVPSVATVRPDVDPAISDWVDRLLVKDPRRRTRSAVAAWQQLDEVLIAGLGPRWNRGAALVPGTDLAVPAFETPTTATGKTPVRETARWAATRRPRRAVPPPPAPRRPRRGKLAAPVLVALALVVGAVLGIAGQRSDGRPASLTSTHALSLAAPSGWKQLHAIPETGLPLSDALALAPDGRDNRPAVVYGLMPTRSAGTSALLPAPFLASLGRPAGEIPARARVTLSAEALPAWRYRRLRPLGSTRELTAYVVATDAGVATVACLAPPRARAMPARACEAIASTLRLRRARPYPLGPSDVYAAALTSIVGSLRQAVATHGRTLMVARTRRGRARAANAIADDYRRAARRFAGLTLSPADYAANRDLVSALRRVARAYAKVTRAARGDLAAVVRARATAVRRERAVAAALAGLRAIGYGTKTSSDRPAPAPTKHRAACGDDERSDDPSDDAGECGEA